MLKIKLLLFLVIGARLIVANEITIANNAFALDLYKEMTKLYTGDFVVSPTSIELICGFIIANQEDHVASLLTKILYLPETIEERKNIFNIFFHFILSNTNLRMANKIFVEDVDSFTADFRKIVENIYIVDIEEMEFADAEQAAFNINTWVERKTDDNLKNVISDKDIYENSSIFLNVLHFNGYWINKFDESNTQIHTFNLNSTHQIEVEMMNQLNTLRFYTDKKLRAKFLELPYSGHNTVVTIALPYDVNGFAQLEQRIGEFLNLELPYGEVDVKATIPKFVVETKFDLKTIMDNLSTEDKISPHLESVTYLQKNIIAFEEKGSFSESSTMVASYSTGARFGNPSYTNLFTANRPFIYYIKSGDLVLYVGRYTGVENT